MSQFNSIKEIGESLNGKGIYYHADGSRYDGDFKDGILHGNGIYYYSDGRKIEGEWKNDRIWKVNASNTILMVIKNMKEK